MVSTDDGTFGQRKKSFHLEKKQQTQITTPWTIIGRGGEPRWTRERRCLRKPGRRGAGELGLEKSSVAVPSRKAEAPVVVWVRSVRGKL